ncbi:MAG: TlpA family protein disulfide reductase [Fidelibacterota bacterium]
MRIFFCLLLFFQGVLFAAPTDSTVTMKKNETNIAVIKMPSFFATGLNTKSFFLSRHISPKVRPENKKNMLFSFFTTSCIPCRKEIPFLSEQIDKYNIEKAYLVNVGEKEEQVRQYIDHYQYDMNILLDPYGMVAKKLKVTTTPVMMIVSGDGELLYRHNGFLEPDTMEIARHLKEWFVEDDQ